MAQRTKDILKGWFKKGDKPTEQQFADLIDSFQQTIETNDCTELELLVDGFSRVTKMGLFMKITTPVYDPWSAANAYDAPVSLDASVVANLQRCFMKMPVHVVVSIESTGESRVLPVKVMRVAGSWVLQGSSRDFSYSNDEGVKQSTYNTMTLNVADDGQGHVYFSIYTPPTSLDENGVRATKMSGVNFTDVNLVTSTDSLIVAIGKLQAQIIELQKEPEAYINLDVSSVELDNEGQQTAQVSVTSNGDWTVTELTD